MNELENLGWDSFWERTFLAMGSEATRPCRVVSDSRERFLCAGAVGERPATPAGRLRLESRHPVTGDWVAVRSSVSAGPDIVVALAPARSVLSRRATGDSGRSQVIAANVDQIFVVIAADSGLNLRRLERYLALAQTAEIAAAVVLNKIDLAADAGAHLARLAAAMPDVPVFPASAATGEGLPDIETNLRPRETIALVGSSGGGKSTIINRLLGIDLQAIGEVRARDGRGRHTTTRRQLVRLPGGALLLDTPGLREVGVTCGLDPTPLFREVDEISAGCRFRDCRHGPEPGCAVRAAVGEGRLDRDRVAHREKLQREADFEARRGDPEARAAEKRRIVRIHKDARRRERFGRG